MKILRHKIYTGGLDRVPVVEVEVDESKIAPQMKVEFYTMKEILDSYVHFFDCYGNLVIQNKDGSPGRHLAPSFFAHLGTIQHINKGCGFDLERTFIKRVIE